MINVPILVFLTFLSFGLELFPLPDLEGVVLGDFDALTAAVAALYWASSDSRFRFLDNTFGFSLDLTTSKPALDLFSIEFRFRFFDFPAFSVLDFSGFSSDVLSDLSSAEPLSLVSASVGFSTSDGFSVVSASGLGASLVVIFFDLRFLPLNYKNKVTFRYNTTIRDQMDGKEGTGNEEI